MARKFDASQFRSQMRTAVNKFNNDLRREVNKVNAHNRQVIARVNREIDGYNRKVRQEAARHNQQARIAVAKYNQAVRTHNSRVTADRQRLRASAATIRVRTVSTSYASLGESTATLHERQQDLANFFGASPTYAQFLEMAERESANGVAVVEALLDDSAGDIPADDTGILEYLTGLSEDLCDRWRGAIFALNPINPDAARHFCTSAREIFTEILEVWAEDGEVEHADPQCDRTPQGKPTRKAKIRYLLGKKGMLNDKLEDFIETDITNIVQLFGIFNQATHGTAGKHNFMKLKAIRKRVEDGIMFLATIAA